MIGEDLAARGGLCARPVSGDDGRMMVVFEVHVAPGNDPAGLLSAETLRDTAAQVMTLDDARKVGFAGLPDAPHDHEVRYIAVAKRDAAWIHKRLEITEAVATFRMFDVD